jgi:glycosyltransferase involved in cell wall biosynthesis
MATVGDDILNVRPLISVGMPVFNEEKFLKQSIESILNQDYVNFELIISDNASTDQTEQICLDFEKKDRRVKYKRNRANLGALENFYKVFQEANGEFFMFAGGHDLWSNNFISTCLTTLQDCPETVLSFASTVWINEFDLCIEKKSPFYDTRGCDPVTRFMYVLWGPMNPIYGIMRIRDMKKVRMNIHTIGLDLIYDGK